MRGEDAVSFLAGITLKGSPPHARGRQHLATRCMSSSGITPACAGKTNSYLSKCGFDKDHPRMRGEDSYPSFPALYAEGSPPHARGRPSMQNMLANNADHPRMRGED